MADFTITFARSARKELEILDNKNIKRLFIKILELAKNPRPIGCKKLAGNKSLWRIRSGDYRIVYAINDKQKNVDVIIIRHRKDVYNVDF